MNQLLCVLVLFCLGIPFLWADLVWVEKEGAFESKALQEEIPIVFVCVNKGSKPVRIVSVSSPCNCLQIHVSNKPIAVGKKRALTVLFKPSGQSGQRKLSFKINTDEEGGKAYPLAIRGVLPAAVTIEPSVIVWNRRVDLAPRIANISVAKGVPLEIMDIYSMDENFMSRRVLDSETGGYKVTITPQDGEIRRLARLVVIAKDKKGRHYFYHMLMRVVDRDTSQPMSEVKKSALYWPEELAQLKGKKPRLRRRPRTPDLSRLKNSLPKGSPAEPVPAKKTPRKTEPTNTKSR